MSKNGVRESWISMVLRKTILFFCFFVYFFFQAEDGIRDRDVTGVQTVLFRSASLSKISFTLGGQVCFFAC